jgi:hypothetical protein
VLPISAPFNRGAKIKLLCKLFTASKNIVATPSQDLALRFVVSVIIRGTRDIKLLQALELVLQIKTRLRIGTRLFLGVK